MQHFLDFRFPIPSLSTVFCAHVTWCCVDVFGAGTVDDVEDAVTVVVTVVDILKEFNQKRKKIDP